MKRIDRRAFLVSLVFGASAGLVTVLGRARAVAAAAGAVAKTTKAVAAPVKAAGPELIERNAWPEHWETSLEALGRSWLTRNDRFFVRSHLPVPDVDPSTYQLEITGLVHTPLTLTLADLAKFPAYEASYTLECAGNGRAMVPLASTSGTQWERGAVGNASWGGVPLRALAAHIGALPEAKHVWFEGADKPAMPETPAFVRSVPIEKAMLDVLLATTMNDEPLSRLHGGPLRAIVPGWFGMASTKWLTRIRFEATPADGHFMVRGYRYNAPGEDPAGAAPVEEMKIKSVITRPLEGSRVAVGKVRIQGFAWSGPGGVRLVEVSADGGKNWKPAGFMGETAPMAWRAWATEIEVKTPARLSVMARATDLAGNTQPLDPPMTAGGYGNNAIHKVSFRVA